MLVVFFSGTCLQIEKKTLLQLVAAIKKIDFHLEYLNEKQRFYEYFHILYCDRTVVKYLYLFIFIHREFFSTNAKQNLIKEIRGNRMIIITNAIENCHLTIFLLDFSILMKIKCSRNALCMCIMRYLHVCIVCHINDFVIKI